MIVDIDLKFNMDDVDGRVYTEEHIEDVILTYLHWINYYIEIVH